MSYSGIEHKLRVFISSKCGGKYAIARKALKTLLDVTGLVETYVFEDDPASSEDTQSAYLEYVDNSNLCIFLIDNEDGVPPAVLSEEKRAKDKHLRLLYLFCDENKKDPTPMQEEIRASLSQKYLVVHEFADIVSKAYNSVMQDVITVYKKKDEPFSVEEHESESAEGESFNVETNSLPISILSNYPYVATELTKSIFQKTSLCEKTEVSQIERLLSDHLKTVLFQKPFDETIIDRICNEVLTKNEGEICEVLRLRYQAQKCYYLTQYDKCLELLQQTISICVNTQSIPTWITNDIAIDILNIQGHIDERNSTYSFNTLGQKLIEKSEEPVYFPYLDRQVESMQEKIANKYYSEINTSPYTINLGGVDQIFSPLVNAYCIAEMYGSIVQTEMTRDRLVSVYSMLCTLYEDHDLLVEYMKYLITNRDAKKLDTVIRTYNQSIDILNGQDVDEIMNCINHMFDPVHQMMSKYLLVSRLGYYMSDTAYSALYQELVEYAMRWLCEDNRIFNVKTYIFDFFKKNTYRAKSKDMVTFICDVFNRNLESYHIDCLKVLQEINFSALDCEDQTKIKKILIDITSKENEQLLFQYCSSVIIFFCKNAKVSYEDLETKIAEKHPDFYQDTFLLEISSSHGQDFLEYIKACLEEAESRNKTQGKNGSYTRYPHESFDVIYNIIVAKDISISAELLRRIIDACLETLSSKKQTIQAKRAAIRLLQLAYFRTKEQDSIWDETSRQMIANMSTFSVGREMDFFSKDTNYILSFQYRLFIHVAFEHRSEVLLDQLYSTDSSEAYTIVQHLNIIADILKCAKDQLEDEPLVLAFLYYCIFMSQHKERDVKYYASLCLIELTNFAKSRRLALIHLSRIMDCGSPTAKIAILTRLGQVQDNESEPYLIQIINKGKSDSNYLVRFAVARKNLE